MKDYERLLAAILLELASNVFANHSCEDFYIGKFLTLEQRHELMKAYHAWNGDPEEYDPESTYFVEQDSALMAFLATRLFPEGADHLEEYADEAQSPD